MADAWSNWSGSLRFRPARIEAPETEAAVVALVRRAAADGRTLRPAGSGHSSSPILQTEDILVSLEVLKGVLSHDRAACEATLGPGMTIHEAGQALLEVGLAMHNTGDVDVQMVGGAIGTGTHGTGRRLQNLSAVLLGGRLVTGTGDIVAFSAEEDADLVGAARVALGTLGIFTAVRLRLLPAFQLRRQEWCTHIDDCLARLDELIESNRNFDFYWYPRNDEAKLRTLNEPGRAPERIAHARLVEDRTGSSATVLPKWRDLKFDEMEYALPAEAGPACFQAVRQRVKERHRKQVGWRLLYRTVAADDAFLSPAYGRETVTISVHQNAGLPFWDYFRDIEPIFRAHGGRPHWGKKHSLGAEALRPLYPMWDRFLEVRRRMDPEGVFLTPYLRRLLGPS